MNDVSLNNSCVMNGTVRIIISDGKDVDMSKRWRRYEMPRDGATMTN